jgi:hypothetical protein
MTTNDQRARKLAKKVEEAPTGFSSRGASLTLVEAYYEQIVDAARACLEMKDDQTSKHYPKTYATRIGTLDGLVWGYCFAWDNSYEPHFTEARARVRRKAIAEARRRINEDYERQVD